MKTIKFGNYWQSNDKNKEAIEWKVLAKENGKALLISKYALDCKPYNQSCCNITWEECTLRKWINSDFINNAFSEEEQQAIILTKNDTNGSRTTEDKIFLLSVEEANTYLNQEERKCRPTPYAKQHNAWASNDGYSYWWLRSPGNIQNYAAYMHYDGYVGGIGDIVSSDNNAVRVAMWIDSSKLKITKNKGKKMKTFNKKDVFCIANAEDAIQYINQECYFEDSFKGLQYCIDNNITGLLTCVRDDDDENPVDCIFVSEHDIKVMDGRHIMSFGLCLPCKLVEKKEPKYRAFNGIEEFEKTLNIKLGDLVEFMDTTIRRTVLYTGNGVGISGTQYITLGGYVYQFKDLFKDCKLILDGKLVPFGILDEE